MKNFLCSILVCFLVFLAAPAHAVTLISGTSTSGTAPPSPGSSTETFSGTTGQTVRATVTVTGGLSYTIYKPGGAVWTTGTTGFSGALPATGTYTMVLVSTVVGQSAGYRIDYVAGAEGVSNGSLTSGGGASGTLAVDGLNSYTFTGTAGRGMQISVGTGGAYSMNIYVWKPDGTAYTSSTGNWGVNALPVSGTYTVVLQGGTYSNTGAYNIWYVEGNNTVSEGVNGSGTVVNSSIDSGNQLRSYTISGTANQAFAFHVNAAYNVQTYFYKPDGSYWTSGANYMAVTALPVSGTYTVIVFGTSIASTGPYITYYSRGADSTSEGWLVNGLSRPGTLPATGVMSYKFKGKASTAITVSTTGSFTRTFNIIKPDGSNYGQWNNTITGTLPAVQGEYTLLVFSATITDTGPYTVTVSTTPYNDTASTIAKCPACEAAAAARASAAAAKAAALAQGPANAPALTAPPGAPAGTPSGPQDSLSALADTMAANMFDINGAAPFAGSTINFDTGSEEQAATDYRAGGLSFTRVYRSDSTFTNNTVGTLWRHNYARTLSVPGSTASITDGTGATRTYTLTGGVWVADDPSNMAKLATITGGYSYTLPNNTVEKYNSSKLLTRIEYLGGGALNLTYNGSSQLTGVANENGLSLSLTYDGSGRVGTVVTPDGTFTYGYDANSNLTTVTKPDTHTKQYLYTNGTYIHALTGAKDEKGNQVLTVAYDGSGRATSSQGNGSVDNFGVTYNTNTSVVTNPLSKSFTYNYNNIQGVRRIIQIDGAASTNTAASSMYLNYDSLGRLIGTTDWNNVMTRYEYDSRSNVTKIIEALSTANQRITTISWDATFNLPNVITEPGRTTDFDYDAYGRVTTVTVTDTATSAQRITTYTYYTNTTDPNGNAILGRVHVIDGPRTDLTDTTTYAYDGNLALSTVTNALSQVTTVTARDSAGRPTKITDPNSVETDIAYNNNNEVTSVIRAFGTGLAATTGFTYDNDSLLTKITLPNSVYVSYSYDNAQRLTGVTDVPGNTIAYTLDNAGNATQTQANNTTPALTYTHTRTYDELSRLLHSVGSASQTAIYAWDTNSNLTTYTDPRTNATGYTYDPLQRLATATDALTGVVTPGFDALDNLTSVKDQRNNSTTYTFNAFGDVTGETSPDRGTLSYTVDKAGNVTQRTDARSVVTNFTYDAINRPLTAAYPSDTSLNVSLTYDSSSGCGTPYVGHLCSVTDAAGSTAYQYDSLGRLTQGKDTRGALNFTTSYSYDLAGNITGLTLPSGRTVTYTLDSNGRVSGVSATVNGSSTTLASSGTYLPFGPMKGLTYGNSLTFSATFDHDYYPTNRTVSGSIYNWTYTTDANGNITQAGTPTYGYDVLNRVNAENPGSAISYTYDAADNRLTKVSGGTTTTTVPSTSNKISAVGANSYTYDAAGNITADGTNTYTWSAAGLLSIVKVGGTTVGTYTYNAWNQRAKKVAASTTYYVYGAGGLLYGEYDNTGAFIREYVTLNGAPLSQINAGSPEVLTYLHTDHLGTPRFGTNASGTQVWAWTNDAFGTSTPTGAATVNLRMPGQYYDSESGLFYNRNRYYNPAIGRYISSDLTGIAGGLNTFGYVGDTPLNGVDPSGNWSADAHDKLIRNALTGVAPGHDILILQAASRNVDTAPGGQDADHAYMHSMRAPFQTPEEAKKLRDQFVESNMKKCKAALAKGDRDKALAYLGTAMHPVMDASSPMHTDAKGEPRQWVEVNLYDAYGHSPTDYIGNERSEDITPDIMRQQTQKLRTMYEDVFGKKM